MLKSNSKFFALKSADVRIWKKPSPMSAWYPHWTTAFFPWL